MLFRGAVQSVSAATRRARVLAQEPAVDRVVHHQGRAELGFFPEPPVHRALHLVTLILTLVFL